jgi:hypothetical protein
MFADMALRRLAELLLSMLGSDLQQRRRLWLSAGGLLYQGGVAAGARCAGP